MPNKKRILLTEDSFFIAMMLSEFLNKNGYDVSNVTTGEEAVQIACSSDYPDLILMDIELAGEMNGIEAARIIINNIEIPIIFLTALASDKIIDQIRNVNAYGFLEKGMNNTAMLATIEMALKLHAIKEEIKEKESILNAIINSVCEAIIMVDKKGNITLWNPAAEQIFGYTKQEILGKNLPLILTVNELEYNSSEGKSKKHLSVEDLNMEKSMEAKALHKLGHELDIEISVSTLNINDDTYFVGIIRDISERIRLREELEMQSLTDFLTGTYNRRYFMERLESEINRAKRNGKEFSLAMLDIDHFKNINDRFGHNAGDIVLKSIAEMIKDRIRNIDCLARWGGEEFMILLTDTPISKANVLLEELRQGISKINISGMSNFTGSFGVVGFNSSDTTETMVQKADSMMYAAKSAGRNCIKYMI
ncbi:MAG: diguanylate cyclase [Sedimentibacter sp.]